MDRRQWLKSVGVVGAALVLPPTSGCGAGALLGLKPWSEVPSDPHDVRLTALAYAILAPSSHNTQPWLVALRGADVIDVYVDRHRLLPEVDPQFRQTHVSQGTFLELLSIALSQLGYRAELQYFPDGEYTPTAVDDRAVARVQIARVATRRDPLFVEIQQRRTNKLPYAPQRELSNMQIAALVGAPDPDGPRLRVMVDAAARARLAALCVDAMRIEISARARNAETATWFRFNDDELEQKRDGFGLVHNGVTGLKRWFAEAFVLSRASAADPQGSFAQGAVDLTVDQTQSVSAFGVLTSADGSRRSQVKAGRAYARIALTAQALGLALQPLSQMLEEYRDMAGVKAKFEREIALAPGAQAQMFFRLGYADASAHTPRREVQSLLRTV